MALKLGTATPSKLYVGSTEVTKAYLGASEVYSSGPALDPDAAAYITAVETADGQALEAGLVTAINDFVVGCKADGIWTAIKASCILAGARTLSGALVPLAGTAPTNFNFVSGDYNRKTGLVGDGSTKYLDSNRNNNADPQDNQHMSVWASTAATSTASTFPIYIGAGALGTGATHIGRLASDGVLYLRNRNSEYQEAIPGSAVGLLGMSRNSSSSYVSRVDGINTNNNVTSQTPLNQNVIVFAASSDPGRPSNGRLAFYSIGEAIDLALLDARVSTLIAALQFGINTGLAASDYDADTVAYVNRGYAAGGSLA